MDLNARRLSLIIPVYFNAGSLPALFAKVQQLETELARLDLGLELIFVDDGSGDRSLELLRGFKSVRPATRIIKLTRNFGSMRALRAGLDFVTGDCLAYLSADLQDPPELIVEMARRWCAGAKYVVCERTARADPWATRLWAAAYYKLVRALVIGTYPKRGFDLALMDQAFLPHLKETGKHVNLALYGYWLGFKPEVIPYERVARVHGRSRWTWAKKWKLMTDSILTFSSAPVRLISAVGLLVSLGSFAYGAVVVVSALLGKIPVSGFATLAALISFLLGLIIVMLGIISEYVWRIFDEVNRHPHAVIDEID